MSIKRNSVYNLGGAVAPLIVTLLTVPLYLAVIEEARYGLLALVWLLLGYFGLFDMGLSTATTNALAQAQSAPASVRGRIFLTSFLTQLALGLAISATVLLVAPLAASSIALPDSLRNELLGTIPWLAAAIPLVTIGGVLNGVLAAREEFGASNLVNIMGSLLFQLTPLWAAYTLGPELQSIIPAAICARAVPILVMGIMVARRIDLLGARFDPARLRSLLTYGAWIMLTSLVGPLLTFADQFVVGAVLGTSAVAHYNVAYSLAVRASLVPSALGQTLFPQMSRISEAEARNLAAQSLLSITLLMTLVCIPAILLVRPFIAWWLSPGFAAFAGPVAEILLVGMWINGLAASPFVFLRARGRPDVAAKYHVMELAPYVIALYLGIYWLGLVGAALVWAGRVTLDTALLIRAARIPSASLSVIPAAAGLLGAALLLTRAQILGAPALIVVATIVCGAVAQWILQVDPLLGRYARLAVRKITRGPA